MPATQRGYAYRLGSNRWGLRYRDGSGKRLRKSPFPSKSAALAHYREQIEPELLGETPAAPELTLSELVDLYLERHAVSVRPRTISTLRKRLLHATRAFGDVPLRELERMPSEIAGWRARLPERAGHGIAQALRQVLGAGVRWELMATNPAVLAGPNRQPPPRPVRAYSRDEVEAIGAELSPMYAPLPVFAAATGLRPEEWQALERRDIDRDAGIVNVRRTVSSGEVVDLAKTRASRRQVPLSARAAGALAALPARLDTTLVFSAKGGGLLNLDNFRRREWSPAIEASGVPTPARIYDLRSTFASDALAAGVGVHALARIMGTSIAMIERHYGTLLDGAMESIATRLDALDRGRDQAEDGRP